MALVNVALWGKSRKSDASPRGNWKACSQADRQIIASTTERYKAEAALYFQQTDVPANSCEAIGRSENITKTERRQETKEWTSAVPKEV